MVLRQVVVSDRSLPGPVGGSIFSFIFPFAFFTINFSKMFFLFGID